MLRMEVAQGRSYYKNCCCNVIVTDTILSHQVFKYSEDCSLQYCKATASYFSLAKIDTLKRIGKIWAKGFKLN